MSSGPSGEPLARSSNHRFELPSGEIEVGRSRPKRIPPPRSNGNANFLYRAAFGVATFAITLVIVALIYGFTVSVVFRDVALENGTTAAVALLIGCFALPTSQRLKLSQRLNALVCFIVIAITPWTYQLGNRMEEAGTDLATGFNFIFEILLAVFLYRLTAHVQRSSETIS